jgi:two-component system cell cycle sensor histidine kinase/response regulator CckA
MKQIQWCSDMSEPLRVLIVEDSEDEVLSFVRELRRGGYDVAHEQAATADAMAAALQRRRWDIVIGEHPMPQFGSLSPLAVLKQTGRDIPFIIVSSAIGEDSAVRAMKDGARDYIVKTNLARLTPAVRRELREAMERRARGRAEEDLRKSEEQVRQSQKLEAIGRLAGGVAHDFNNHLTIIIGYCQLLMDRKGPVEAGHNEVGIIKDAAVRAASLTRQLLAFSRKQVLEARVLDLNTILTSLNPMLQRLIGEDVQLLLSLDPKLGKVKADPSQIEQVIMNLVVNARDAMTNGGTLTIETANANPDKADVARFSGRPGSCVRLTVSDTGVGMEPDIQAHIFEPFFTTKTADKGTGLGLATVYGIVQQSGGCISIRSAVGQGTTVHIYIPQTEVEETVVTEAEVQTDLKGSETVLIAEDEEMLRRLVRKYLLDAGYRVLEASNGVEAIGVYERHQGKIDIVVTDAIMPNMGGAELAQCLLSRQPDIKVIYFSGYTDDAVYRNGLLTPGAAFLEKPFTREGLLRKLRAALGPQVAPKPLRRQIDETYFFAGGASTLTS